MEIGKAGGKIGEMRIKFERKEVLKFLKWRSRRKFKKAEKKRDKEPKAKSDYQSYINEMDDFLAGGLE